jgi:putative restriction endonuclease
MMKAWLLLTVEDSDRTYGGNAGYLDDLRVVYRYDSFVANFKNVAEGDVAFLRNKEEILGTAVVERVESEPGEKQRLRCPECNKTKLKIRRRSLPAYRCECGAEFDDPHTTFDRCSLFSAYFGSSYSPLPLGLEVEAFWNLAPRLNKQHSILELDLPQARSLIADLAPASGHPDELPPATARLLDEGGRSVVFVNRVERDPRVRRDCLLYHGTRCKACGVALEDVYGDAATGLVQVHHLIPLGDGQGSREIDPVNDTVPLCPNCHSVAHRRSPPFSVKELQEMRASKG